MTKKIEYCCNSLKMNLNNDCLQHGWECPDNLIYFDGDKIIKIPCDHGENDGGFYWEIKYCPFCGKKIEII